MEGLADTHNRTSGGFRRTPATRIVGLWRRSDNTAYWKEVTDAVPGNEHRLAIELDGSERRV